MREVSYDLCGPDLYSLTARQSTVKQTDASCGPALIIHRALFGTLDVEVVITDISRQNALYRFNFFALPAALSFLSDNGCF